MARKKQCWLQKNVTRLLRQPSVPRPYYSQKSADFGTTRFFNGFVDMYEILGKFLCSCELPKSEFSGKNSYWKKSFFFLFHPYLILTKLDFFKLLKKGANSGSDLYTYKLYKNFRQIWCKTTQPKNSYSGPKSRFLPFCW
jgi:hypothetical protein